jgi:hypothetical protein
MVPPPSAALASAAAATLASSEHAESAPGGTPTHNLRVKSALLLAIELRGPRELSPDYWLAATVRQQSVADGS